MKSIAVLLVEDHLIVREGIQLLLKSEPDIEVIGEAGNGRQAVKLTVKLRPDVVVMDIAMPLLNGLEATRQIRKECPNTRVIILSGHSDTAYVEQVISMGAAGFLLKQTSSNVLAEAIREVHAGNLFFSPDIARRLKNSNRTTIDRDGQSRLRKNGLSSREVEVLQLIAEGMPNKQVAAELGVTFKTVDKHRQHLMAKLNIHDIAGLTRYAIAEGVIHNSVRVTIT